ncbi:MAG: enoyl-CoA hydratase/isomerase family protein, partial [Nocardia sp.]|nr:enoyl-CoA hydratase/isomerase family protein [Nocardia sp.]
ATKRVLNIQLEKSVAATLDYATTAEYQSFQTDDFHATIARLSAGKK